MIMTTETLAFLQSVILRTAILLAALGLDLIACGVDATLSFVPCVSVTFLVRMAPIRFAFVRYEMARLRHLWYSITNLHLS